MLSRGKSRKKWILTVLNESDWGAVIVDVERREAIATLYGACG